MASNSSKTELTSQVRLTSLNVKGLNVPGKRSRLLRDLTKMWSQIVILPETYFHYSKIPKLSNRAFPVVYHSPSPISKAKGVNILLARSVPWSLGTYITDEQGRYLIVKGLIGATRVTLINVYFPNLNQLLF